MIMEHNESRLNLWSLLILFLLCGSRVYGQYPNTDVDFVVGGISYNITSTEGKTVEVTYSSYTEYAIDFDSGCSGNIVVPSSVTYGGTTYTVTAIGDNAFSNSKTTSGAITSVSLPNTIQRIGNYAFGSAYSSKSKCTMPTITIPTSVTSIGDGAFRNSGIQSITIPSTVQYIGNSICSNCENLKKVVMEISNIKSNAFSNCISLTSFELNANNTEIGYNAFGKCTGLTDLELGENVKSVGANAFVGCSNLQSVKIGSKVTSIESSAFSGCLKLESISISSSNATYDSRNNCNAIIKKSSNTLILGCKKSSIPNTIKTIGASAFLNCEGINTISIPSSVTSIEESAFSGCKDLTAIEIPTSVTSIGNSAFSNCSNLTSVTLPSSINSMGSAIFQSCSNLNSADLSNCYSLYTLPSNTFNMCRNLVDVKLPSNLSAIGEQAFRNCERLSSIKLGSSISSIGNFAFYFCSGLSIINIPSSVSTIGNYAFSGCSGLKAIIVNWYTPIAITTGCFSESTYTTAKLLSYWSSTVSKLQSTNYWNKFATIETYKSATSINIIEKEATIFVGSTENLHYAVMSSSSLASIQDVTWSSSNEGVAVVDNNGMVTGVSPGKAIITAKTIDGSNLSASCDVTIKESNYIDIDNTQVLRGRQIVLPVSMINTEDITALQFEVSLPNGVTISKCQLTNRKGNDHTASCKKLANGNYQVTAFSGSKAVFSGTEGAVLNLTLVVDENVTAGDYPVSLKNIELTTAATKAINPIDVTAKLTVSDVKLGDVDGNGKISITDAVAVVSHILGEDIDSFVAAAADVDGNGKITITDAVAIVDMILDGTALANERVDVEDDMLDPQ